jgi:hypothetical protein
MGLFDMFGRKPRTEGKKARKTREFKEESERLRKEALAKKPTATKKSTAETKKAKFLAESERLKKEALAKNKSKKKTITDKPMPKRPSAISLQNAATPKPTRPMKPEVPPTSRVKPPKADGRGTVTGKGGRNVGGGAYERANVTKEQLDASGMSLRNYLNFMDKNGKRPPKAKKMMGGGMMKSKMKAKGMKAGGKMKAKGMAKGGMMKSKGMAKGGAMKTKGYSAGGKLPMVKDPKTGKMIPAYAADGKGKMMAGGKVKSKGMAKGGMMKTKGYSKGGVAGGKKNKVRGAGIARKGVRPAKML